MSLIDRGKAQKLYPYLLKREELTNADCYIVDTDNMESESVQNSYMQAGGGAGIQAAQFVTNKDVEAVITGNVGPNSFQVLKEAGINFITGVSGNVKKAVERYINGEFKSSEKPTVNEEFGMSQRNKKKE